MCYFKMRRQSFHATLRIQNVDETCRVAAVGNAENTTSNVHDTADVRYCFVFYASFEISYVPTRMTNSKR